MTEKSELESIRKASPGELKKMKEEMEARLFVERSKSVSRGVKKPSQFGKTRKKIARISTFISEKLAEDISESKPRESANKASRGVGEGRSK